jgi:hypothetical protein
MEIDDAGKLIFVAGVGTGETTTVIFDDDTGNVQMSGDLTVGGALKTNSGNFVIKLA